MRLIDADALIEVIKKSMAENPHKEEMQRAMHIHEHKYFLTLLAGIPTIQPVATDTNVGNNSEFPNNSDTVSRQAAIDAVEESRRLNHHEDGKEACCHEYEHRHFLKILYELPSTQPERKMGHWIYEERKRLVDETDDGPVYRTEKWWSCSECGYAKGYQISKPSSNYCENCGAKMLKDGE